MSHEILFTNARIVTADEIVHGTLALREGRITTVDPGRTSVPGARDLEGDLLLPGLVELHTDNFERHAEPRPETGWPSLAALLQHDAELSAAGITTAYDALCVGASDWCGNRSLRPEDMLQAIEEASAGGMLRAEHRIHMRCELPAADARTSFLPFHGHPKVGLVSLMDHTPGQGQWRDLERARVRYAGRQHFESVVAQAPSLAERHAAANRRFFVAYAREHGLALASHDDASPGQVAQAHDEGVTLAEFPTTLEAAREARRFGMRIVLGAPNVVRGGSHAGNVSAMALAREGLLDVLSSDYVPGSLLPAAFRLVHDLQLSVPEAVATVSRTPALALGLADRGEIASGKRADLVQVRLAERPVRPHPVVRAVWREGTRIS